MDEKQHRINKLEQYCAEYRDKIESLTLLAAGLAEWKGKNIDKRFFEQNLFAYTQQVWEDRQAVTYHYFSMHGKRWEWSTDHTNQIYFGNHVRSNFDINGRETAHVLERTREEISKHENWLDRTEAELVELLSLDEEQIKADLIEVCRKHGYPKIWGEILKSYEVTSADYKGRKED